MIVYLLFILLAMIVYLLFTLLLYLLGALFNTSDGGTGLYIIVYVMLFVLLAIITALTAAMGMKGDDGQCQMLKMMNHHEKEGEPCEK